MKDADRERMLRERKEYNKSRDQNRDQGRQIQQLQQQLSVAHSVNSDQHQHRLPPPPPAPTDVSVGQVSQMSHMTDNTRRGSTMFGGRNEQAHYRQRGPP
jgi:transcription elongation GreA/GreB family factor